MTEDTATLVETWSTGDLAAKIASDSPDEDSFVMRVLAARIAERADQCHDPLHLLKDLSRVTAALAEAVRELVPRHASDELENPASMSTFRDALDHLEGAAASLDDLQRWF